MSTIGKVDSLWRYPVKSMRGEEVPEIFAGFGGIYCDRLFAFRSPATHQGLPYLTAREQPRMLCFQPRFRQPEKAIAPPNLAEAQRLGAGATPVYADADDLALDVETPAGGLIAIDDPSLPEMLVDGVDDKPPLTLRRSERAQTDCRPISLISRQSIAQLARETGQPIDHRRFRANVYLDLTSSEGFAENQFVGRSLRIGPSVVVAVLHRDTRCMILTLDPETGDRSPAPLRTVAQKHDGQAGVYAVVVVEGMIRQGDPVELLA